jgi:hypothetical protein
MNKREKRFEKWLNNSPNEIPFSGFKSIVEENGLKLANPASGSHYKIYHPEWDNFQHEESRPGLDIRNNTYSVPVHKNRIKKRYYKTVLEFIKYLQEKENV